MSTKRNTQSTEIIITTTSPEVSSTSSTTTKTTKTIQCRYRFSLPKNIAKIWIFLSLLSFLAITNYVDIKIPFHGGESSTLKQEEEINVPLCVWSPNQTEECYKIISEVIVQTAKNNQYSASLGGTTTMQASTASSANGTSYPRRWLFFGDSTMMMGFYNSKLHGFVSGDVKSINKKCPSEYSCHAFKSQRCNLTNVFGLPPPTHPWIPPNFSLGEGPVEHGLEHPGCQDCSGCNSQFVLCDKNVTAAASSSCVSNHRLPYGTYFSIEFARDVQIQSKDYGTTQENIAEFIHSKFNTPSLLHDFGGKPICVVLTGMHDVIIPSMNASIFVENVNWYVHLLSQQCSNIIWLTNTAPRRRHDQDDINTWPQTQVRIKEWNEAVYESFNSTNNTELANFKRNVVVMDVYETSKSYGFDSDGDNIHKSPQWYNTLGEFYRKLAMHLIQNVTAATK